MRAYDDECRKEVMHSATSQRQGRQTSERLTSRVRSCRGPIIHQIFEPFTQRRRISLSARASQFLFLVV